MRPEQPSLDQEQFNRLEVGEQLKHLVKFALFAPSSHNTQPWLFKIAGDRIEFFPNPERALSVSDPTGREMYISIGAAVENIVVAGKYFGLVGEVRFSESEKQGSIVFSKVQDFAGTGKPDFGQASAEHEKLAEAIFTRHNNRFNYSDQMPDQEFLAWLGSAGSDLAVQASAVSDQAKKDQITEVVGQALQVALDDHDFRQELSHWIKPANKNHKDGMTTDNLAMPPKPIAYLIPMIMRKMKMGKMQKSMETKALKHTPVFVVLSAENNPSAWISVGRTFERIALRAEADGLKIGVMAAAIEIKEFYKDLQKILGAGSVSARPQMFFRLGYCDKLPVPAPRLSLQDVLK